MLPRTLPIHLSLCPFSLLLTACMLPLCCPQDSLSASVHVPRGQATPANIIAAAPKPSATLTANVVKVPPRVKLEVRPHRQPQVAPAPRAPVLQHQPRDGAALAHARAVADEEAAARGAVRQELQRAQPSGENGLR
jgi:hypothetical protein